MVTLYVPLDLIDLPNFTWLFEILISFPAKASTISTALIEAYNLLSSWILRFKTIFTPLICSLKALVSEVITSFLFSICFAFADKKISFLFVTSIANFRGNKKFLAYPSFTFKISPAIPTFSTFLSFFPIFLREQKY